MICLFQSQPVPAFCACPIATLIPATVTGRVVTPADDTTAGTETTGGGLVSVTWAVWPGWAWMGPGAGTRVWEKRVVAL